MKSHLLLLLGLSWGGAALAAAPAQSSVAATNHPGRRDIQFGRSSPLFTPVELFQRFRINSSAPAYNVALEKFRLTVPPSYVSNGSWGLFVWVSPGDRPTVPEDWQQVLEQHRLLFVGAYNSGNPRHLLDRFRLALDATFNVQQAMKIDRRRIYVSGFSGGGRVASMLGVACPDIFAGAIPICGVDFYMPVPAGPGQFFPASYVPQPHQVHLAKTNSHFVLITGETDGNRLNTDCVYREGFRKNGFAHVNYMEVPGMGHGIPAGTWLDKALRSVEGVTD